MRTLIVGLCSVMACFVWAEPNRQDNSKLFQGLPPGEGQLETFAFCSPCHSVMIVRQQRLSRQDWQETLVWMVDKQGMDELPEEVRPLILNYLARHYGPEN